MKKTGFLFFVLILGHIKALDPDIALASLEVNLNQLFEPNISLFYDSSLKALDDAYTAAFGKLVGVGALGKESFKDKDADYEFQQGFVIEVEDEKQQQALTDEFNTLEKNLKKALDDYQVMFGISNTKTGQPKNEDDLSFISNLLKSPLMRVQSEIKVKPEPEPEIELVFEGFETIAAQTPAAGDDAAALKAKWDAKDKDDYNPKGLTEDGIKKAINTLIELYKAMKSTDEARLAQEIKGVTSFFNVGKKKLASVADQATAQNAWDKI